MKGKMKSAVAKRLLGGLVALAMVLSMVAVSSMSVKAAFNLIDEDITFTTTDMVGKDVKDLTGCVSVSNPNVSVIATDVWDFDKNGLMDSGTIEEGKKYILGLLLEANESSGFAYDKSSPNNSYPHALSYNGKDYSIGSVVGETGSAGPPRNVSNTALADNNGTQCRYMMLSFPIGSTSGDDSSNPTDDASDSTSGDNFGKANIANTDAVVQAAIAGGIIEEGEGLELEVTAKDANEISNEDKTLIAGKMPAGYQTANYLDVNLYKINVAGERDGKITKLPSGNLLIRFDVPQSLQREGRTYKIIRVHEGVATVLDTKQESGYSYSFETNEFSTYALIYADAAPAPAPAPTSGSTSPKTGDTSTMPFVALIVAMGALGLGLVSRKRIVK